jgi:predicted permease
VPAARVREELTALGRRMADRFVESRGRTLDVGPLDTGSAAQLRPLFASLIALTSIVLVLVCSNVANLLLVRGASRIREVGLRFALGATRARMVLQLMLENTMLAAGGALAGVGFAAWGRAWLVGLLPTTTVPIDVQAPLDARVLRFVVAVTAATVVGFGLLPAFVTSRVRVTAALAAGASRFLPARGRIRAWLVVGQVALCLATLVSTTLFLRRARYEQALDRGFADPAHVLLIQTEASLAGYGHLTRWQSTLDDVADRVRRAPGVRSATWATFVPLGYVGYTRRDVEVEAYTPREDEAMRVLVNGVGPGYFDLMGIPIRLGRAISEDDRPDQPAAAVVNEAFVRRFWPDVSPVGRRLKLGDRALTVVGVAKDGRYDYRAIDNPAEPLVYYALRQSPGRFVTLHVRTGPPALSVAPAARDAIRGVDPHFATLSPISLEEYTAMPLAPARLGVTFLTILGLSALILSAMGLQAIVAYGVAVRAREIGIRVALGASPRQVAGVFVRQALVLTAGGISAGLVVTTVIVAILRHQLSYLPIPDPGSIVGPCLLLATVGLVSGYLPARRSTRIDPMATLRTE